MGFSACSPTRSSRRPGYPPLIALSDSIRPGAGPADRNLRVAWVTPTLSRSYGGPTTTTVNGLVAERRSGMRPEILTTVGAGGAGDSMPALERLRDAGVRTHLFRRIGRSSRSEAWGLSPAMVLWMFRHLGAFDVVHVQYVWCLTSIVACGVAKRRGVPVVVTPHESLTDHDIRVASRNPLLRNMKKALRRFFLGNADCLVMMSRLEARDTLSDGVRTEQIFHAVAESARPETDPGAAPKRGGPLKIGFLGRNATKKGLVRLIETLRGPTPRSHWQLVMATSELTGDQKEAVSSLEEPDRVTWLGFVHDPAILFERIDVLVMPSTYEAFGMVAAEAMAYGLPVIVPESSGVAELVEQYEAGIVIPSSSVEDLVEALTRFDGDRDRWPHYSRRGIAAVDQRLTYRAYATATRELYESLIPARP